MLFFEIWTNVSGSYLEKHQHVCKIMMSSLNEVEKIDINCLDSCILSLCKSLDRNGMDGKRYVGVSQD